MRTFETFPNLVTMFFDRARAKGEVPFLWHKAGGEWRSRSWAETESPSSSDVASSPNQSLTR